MAGDPDFEYDVSEDDIKQVLSKFGVPKRDREKTMLLRVIRLITTDKFYEVKEDISGIPDYGFRNHDVATALEAQREQTRRQSGLKKLEQHGLVKRHEPKPQSSKSHWYVAREFRTALEEAPFDDSLPEPNPPEKTVTKLDLPYHDKKVKIGPGNHEQLAAECLENVVPQITEDPAIIHSDTGPGAERDKVKDGHQHLEIADSEYRFRAYPDILILDEYDHTLYFFESVISTNPFHETRVKEMLEPFRQARLNNITRSSPEFDFVFITLFPDVKTYRDHMLDLANNTYFWISNHPEKIRGHKKQELTDDVNSKVDLDLSR
ncbi:BsuBI/PstI restriction endonuclease [Haloarcula quadrata]|uniref:BsuBI/PstI restriction endonuclease n=1 Tax=Haloarcula quadrata TaxID=182779 RepID=A0A495R468_9EURY|nr:BsuBI/PstI family type II restriction endonuclease [Haloarcula quadrata]RKS82113.1 BsuBI/PstI restriction endonuclease [Haloarcula quadrata]